MQKEYIELENVCSSIIRGYTYVRQEVEMSNTAESGTHPVEVISFGDIDDNGTFTTNENTEKYILKNKNAFYKCRAEINDILRIYDFSNIVSQLRFSRKAKRIQAKIKK